MKTELSSIKGSSIKGALKLLGFVSLIVFFVPIHLFVRSFRLARAETMPRLFHYVLSLLLGFRIRVRGQLVNVGKEGGPATLFVSNHSSYLDIIVLGSIIPASFVAKSEVGQWPIIGTLARMQNTIFIERRSVRAKSQQNVLRDRLDKGDSLILFPEGTSSDGHRTLPFKSSLFGIVEEALPKGGYAMIQPVSVVATEVGGLPMGRAWRPYYAWYGDMTLVKHVWEFFKIGSFTVDVVFHPPVTIEDFGSRKLLAEYCERAVASGVDQCVTGRF